jgi:SAM-dependent methyltransferase
MERPTAAAYYDRYWQPGKWWLSDGGLDAIEQKLVAPYATAGSICLDYGCGDGRRYAGNLQALGVSYRGFDISPDAVRRARELGITAELLASDGRTSLEPDSCDWAICFEVFEHLLEPEVALREIKRVLKPSGVLIASVPNAGHWFARIHFLLTGFWVPAGSPGTSRKTPWNDPHIRFFSPAVFRQFVRQEFQSVEIIPNRFSLAALPYIYRKPALARLAEIVSLPLGWISRISPSLFASRLFIRAIKE